MEQKFSYTEVLPIKEAGRILLATLILTFASQIAIPFYPVPMTLQTLVLMAIAYYLPPGQTLLTVLMWVTLGVSGLPTFALLRTGPFALLSVTGGYIWGFLFAAPLASLAYRHTKPGYSTTFLISFLSSLLVLAFGWLQLGFLLENYTAAFKVGVLPFLLVESIKAAIVSAFFRFKSGDC